MYEGRCDDDSRTEVFDDKKGPLGNTGTWMSSGVYGEDGALTKAVSLRWFWKGIGSDFDLPNREPTRMTKMAEMRTPIRPSNSLSPSHAISVAAAAALVAALGMIADGATCLATTRVNSCKLPIVFGMARSAGCVNWIRQMETRLQLGLEMDGRTTEAGDRVTETRFGRG